MGLGVNVLMINFTVASVDHIVLTGQRGMHDLFSHAI